MLVLNRQGPFADLPGVKFELPESMSVLALVGGRNQIDNGDVFSEDGWVYNEGRRIRKWFLPLDIGGSHSSRVWEPKLCGRKANIATLEEKRWRIHQKTLKKMEKEWKEILEKVRKSRPALGNLPGTSRQIVLLYVKDYNYISWKDVGEDSFGVYLPPSVDKYLKDAEENQMLIDDYFRYEKLAMRYNKYCLLFKEAFNLAIKRFISSLGCKDVDKIINFVINGRSYLYRYDGTIIAFPNDILDIKV
jgi:hypothetical protein